MHLEVFGLRIPGLSEREEKMLLGGFVSAFEHLYPLCDFEALRDYFGVQNFNLQSESVIVHEKNDYMVVFENYNRFLNIYITAKKHVDALKLILRGRNGNYAVCCQVLIGTLKARNKSFEVRLGVFGVPCYKVEELLAELKNSL